MNEWMKRRSTCGCRRVWSSRSRRWSSSLSSTSGRDVTTDAPRRPPSSLRSVDGPVLPLWPPCSAVETRCRCRHRSTVHRRASTSSRSLTEDSRHRQRTTRHNYNRPTTYCLYVVTLSPSKACLNVRPPARPYTYLSVHPCVRPQKVFPI